MYEIRRILVPVDFSECSERALGVAIGLARATGADLVLLYVQDGRAVARELIEAGDDEPGLTTLENDEVCLWATWDKVAVDYREATGKAPPPADRIAVRVAVGAPADGILALAHELAPDLVVMGTAGRDSLRDHLLGSTTEQIVRRAPCAVLAVKPGGPPVG